MTLLKYGVIALSVVSIGAKLQAPPTALDVSITVRQGEAARVPYAGSDSDGDLFGFHATSPLSNPAAGTLANDCTCVATLPGVVVCDCTTSFTASTTFVGTATYQYEAVDRTGLVSPLATVTITVVSSTLSLADELARFDEQAAAIRATIERLYDVGLASNRGVVQALGNQWNQVVTAVDTAGAHALNGDLQAAESALGRAIRQLLNFGSYAASQHLIHLSDGVAQELITTTNDTTKPVTAHIATIAGCPVECGTTQQVVTTDTTVIKSGGVITGFSDDALKFKVTFGWATDETHNEPTSALFVRCEVNLPLGSSYQPNPDKPGKLLEPDELAQLFAAKHVSAVSVDLCATGAVTLLHSINLGLLKLLAMLYGSAHHYSLPTGADSNDIQITGLTSQFSLDITSIGPAPDECKGRREIVWLHMDDSGKLSVEKP